MADQKEVIVDPQTGESFDKVPERWFDIVAAWVSIGYSLAAIVYLAWLLLDTCTGVYSAWFMNLYKETPLIKDSQVFKLVVYTAIGGGMGAAVNNIRSFINWHPVLRAFGWRFVWKYISLPPLGATLAVMVYAIVQGGIAAFGGSFSGSGPMSSFSAWATGALAGYGAHQVFIWLDDKVSAMFKVDPKVDVPNLSGKTPEEADKALKDVKLALGDKSEGKTTDPQKIGKVIGQSPGAGAQVAPESKVAITIGQASKGEGSGTAQVDVPDVSGKTRDEAEQALKDGKLALGEESEEGTSDEQKIGKVIGQTPAAGTKANPDSKVAITIGKASDGK